MCSSANTQRRSAGLPQCSAGLGPELHTRNETAAGQVLQGRDRVRRTDRVRENRPRAAARHGFLASRTNWIMLSPGSLSDRTLVSDPAAPAVPADSTCTVVAPGHRGSSCARIDVRKARLVEATSPSR